MREMTSVEITMWQAFYKYEDDLLEAARMHAELQADAVDAKESIGR